MVLITISAPFFFDQNIRPVVVDILIHTAKAGHFVIDVWRAINDQRVSAVREIKMVDTFSMGDSTRVDPDRIFGWVDLMLIVAQEESKATGAFLDEGTFFTSNRCSEGRK